jgi:serine/threonine protein kinase
MAEEGVAAMAEFLRSTVRLRPGPASEYAAGLVAEGYDTPDLFADLTPQELKEDFGFRKGHVKAVEKARGADSAFSSTSDRATQGGRSASALTAAITVSAIRGGAESTDALTLSDGKVKMEAEVLGRGAQGIVRAATLTRKNGVTEAVAAKTLAPGASEKDHQRFTKEYELSLRAAAHCEGVARVYGCTRHNSALVIVMKRYKQSLHGYFLSREKPENERRFVPLPLEQALEFGVQVASALAGLHAVGIIVHDLKPANLLMNEHGALVIADFGIASIEAATMSCTSSRAAGGTSFYMCAELFNEESITSAVDIWSWGIIMVEMVTGEVPWHGMRPQQIAMAVGIKKRTPSIPGVLPESIKAILQQCFEHDPTLRPAASELVDALRTAQQKCAEAAVPAELEPEPEPEIAAQPDPITCDFGHQISIEQVLPQGLSLDDCYPIATAYNATSASDPYAGAPEVLLANSSYPKAAAADPNSVPDSSATVAMPARAAAAHDVRSDIPKPSQVADGGSAGTDADKSNSETGSSEVVVSAEEGSVKLLPSGLRETTYQDGRVETTSTARDSAGWKKTVRIRSSAGGGVLCQGLCIIYSVLIRVLRL